MDYRTLSPVEQANYRVIQLAMVKDPPQTLCFQYVDSEGQRTRREAEPYEMKDGRLFAWCLERDALRQFKLSGMSEVVTGRPFRPRQPIVTDL